LRYKADRQLRRSIPGFRIHQLGLVDRNESRFRLLLVLLAILDHRVETLIDLGRQQILERAAIAIGKCQYDHFIGAARSAEKMPRIERRILRCDAVKSLSQRRAGFGQAFPAIGRRGHICRRRQRGLIDYRAGHRNHLVVLLRPLHDVARRAIVRRPFASGALSEHIAQSQEDEDRQRQEDDGVNIHVVFAFWSAPARAPAVERSLWGRRRLPHGWVCSM